MHKYKQLILSLAFMSIGAGRYWGIDLIFSFGGICLLAYAVLAENWANRCIWLFVSLMLLSVTPSVSNQGRFIDFVIFSLSTVAVVYELIFCSVKKVRRLKTGRKQN